MSNIKTKEGYAKEVRSLKIETKENEDSGILPYIIMALAVIGFAYLLFK